MKRLITFLLLLFTAVAFGQTVFVDQSGHVIIINGAAAATGSGGAPSAPASAYIAQGGAAGTSTNVQAVTWASSAGATSYNIYRGLNGATPTMLASGQSCCTYTDSTATNSNTLTHWTYLNRYTYYVTAVNGSGESAGTYPNAWSYGTGTVNGALGNY